MFISTMLSLLLLINHQQQQKIIFSYDSGWLFAKYHENFFKQMKNFQKQNVHWRGHFLFQNAPPFRKTNDT
jgi:hypothetical protein